MILYRFTRDLRLEDHAGLAAAARHGEILPVLVIDSALRERVSTSPRRAAFFCGAVAALNAALLERGSHLIVRRGPLIATLAALARAVSATGVAWSVCYSDPASDQRLQSAVEERGLRALCVHDAPAIPPEETTMARSSGGEGYRSLVPYVQTWRSLEISTFEAPLLQRFAKPALESEPLPFPEEFGASMAADASATPAEAVRRLGEFLEVDAAQYALAVNVPADDRTSHLAAHLSFGTIAARTIARETRRRTEDPFLLAEERASLRAFARSLAQRDFFLQLAWYNPRMSRDPLQEKMRDFPFARTSPHLDAWLSGRTGYPLVDAGVRQLHGTGWMHPRVRAIAASFLCFDLGVDWRVGHAEWDRWLVEDDPAISIGNWQWIAGVGADLAAYPRIYNPQKQARRFDPTLAYARRWIPELAHVPDAFVRRGERESQIELPLFAGQAYPVAVVDHDAAARAFLERYQAFMTAGVARPANR